MRDLTRYLHVARSHPHILYKKLSSRVKVEWLARYGYKKREGYAPPPLIIDFYLTELCNLRCKMCGLWRNLENPNSAKTLSWKTVRAILDEVSAFSPEIYLGGGEPLLHPHIVDIADYLKQKGMICTLLTNGILLPKYAFEMVKSGVDEIEVSMDGPPNIHDAIRGVGNFEKAMKGIKSVIEAKKEVGARNPMISVTCVAQETNCGHLLDLIELLTRESTVKFLNVILGWFTTEEMGRQNDALFQKLFNIRSTSWKGFVNVCGNPDVKKLKQFLTYVRRRKGPPWISFIPPIDPDELTTYYQAPEKPLVRSMCITPWFFLNILANGDATFCANYSDYIIGNVNEAKIIEIWNGPRARHFRNTLRTHGLFPICSRCCGLYRLL